MNAIVKIAMLLGWELCFFAAPLFCATDVKTAGVQLSVAPLFSIALDKSNLNLGAVEVGSESLGGTGSNLGVAVMSNHGLEWNVALQASPLVHSDGVTKIPSSAFKYKFTASAPGATPPAGSEAPVPDSKSTIYLGQASEALANLQMSFKVAVPPAQKTGNYSTTLTFTLSDNY